MRKGQTELIEKAERGGYSDGCLKVLSDESMTIRQLNEAYRRMYFFKDKEYEWVKIIAGIEDRWVFDIVIDYYRISHFTLRELELLSTRDSILDYFTNEEIVCKDLYDVKTILGIGFHSYTPAVFNLIHDIRNRFDEAGEGDELHYRSYFNSISAVRNLLNVLPDIYDARELIQTIDISECSDVTDIREEICRAIDEYIYLHRPFQISDFDGIPENIKNMDFQGYKMEIKTEGVSVKVTYNTKYTYINCEPYYKIAVSSTGRLCPVSDPQKSFALMYDYKTENFLFGQMSKGQMRYRKARTADVFKVISIGRRDEDVVNAWNVVELLCRKYNTYIFRDLYKDHLQSGGLILPILVSETGLYHSKQEMFEQHYHTPLKGNWNKKNANLTYCLLKLYKRMTGKAIGRIMQHNSVYNVYHIGRKRYSMVRMLYEAVWGKPDENPNYMRLLSDAWKEEYLLKNITLDHPDKIIRNHNIRQYSGEKFAEPFTIKKNTKFKPLINAMPKSFELIKNAKRLGCEAEMQHNCVNGYSTSINRDDCMIYSTVYNNERHTIEFAYDKGKYLLRQCYKSYNRFPDKELVDELKTILETVNKKLA